MAKLLVHETAGIREFEIVDSEVRIGRELDNSLRLNDPSVSRHHAILRRVTRGYEIQDLQSSNGVLINGNRLPVVLLHDEDSITLGQVQLTFSDPPMAHELVTDTSRHCVTTPLPPMEERAAPSESLFSKPPAQPTKSYAPAPSASAEKLYQEATSKILQKGPTKKALAPSSQKSYPAPWILRPWLPAVPDLAKPTGERGDFTTRLMAFLLDSAPFVILMAGVFSLGFFYPKIKLFVGILGGFLLVPLIGIAYGALLMFCWQHFGASPGKKIMKLRIVPEDDPGGRIDIHTALLRMVGHVINIMFFMLPYLMILRKERRSLQDMLSKSLVIKVDG